MSGFGAVMSNHARIRAVVHSGENRRKTGADEMADVTATACSCRALDSGRETVSDTASKHEGESK